MKSPIACEALVDSTVRSLLAPNISAWGDYTVQVISPLLPSGAAWLANIFLELGIPIGNLWGFDTAPEWSVVAHPRYRYTATHQPWRQTLGSLQVDRIFSFHQPLCARFAHAWPYLLPKIPKTIVVLRDPRDALYSAWRRHCRNSPANDKTASFTDFVHQPYLTYPLSALEYTLLFYRLWLAVSNDPFVASQGKILVIRFEDTKTAAMATLQNVLGFLGISVNQAESQRALAASDFRVLKSREVQLAMQNQLSREFNRAGIPYEYQQTFTPSMHNVFDRRFNSTLSALGYQINESSPEPPQYKSWSDQQIESLIVEMAKHFQSLADPVRLKNLLVENGQNHFSHNLYYVK